MSEFVATLRSGIEQAQRALVADDPDQARTHRARLGDLLAVARRTGVKAERRARRHDDRDHHSRPG